MSQERTIDGTVAQFEAWLAASKDEDSIDPALAARALADLFARAQRGGADLHDPTGELLLWLSRDIAQDDEADADPDAYPDAYATALRVLPRYLLFLRAHQLWRRSERAVQACWTALGSMAQRPLGLTTLGPSVDSAIAERLSQRPASADVLAVGLDRGYVAPLRTTLDALATRGELGPAEVAGLIGVEEGSVALEVWQQGLNEADLVRLEDDGRLTPSSEETEAGGCPPPSADLVQAVVRGLVRASLLRVIDADGEAGLHLLPRMTATLMALVGATDQTWLLAEDEDEDEESTAGVVAMFVEKMLGADDERCDSFTVEVLEILQALVRFGVLDEVTLPRGSLALVAPEPFRYAVIRAVTDTTSVVGTAEESAPWEPVELPFGMKPDTALDLLVSLEHDPSTWRRVRINGGVTMTTLHLILQQGFGWRDVRNHLICLSDGTPRFAAHWQLGQLRDEAHEQVVDADAVRLGSVLKAAGDELIYRYGHLNNPWRVRVRVERVMSGMTEAVSWLDSAGEAPSEPTRIGHALEQRLPEGMSIPPELERAWAFMESKRWLVITDDGWDLVAPGPPEARPGIVFSSGLDLAAKVGEGSPVLGRTLPIAISPSETTIALWLDDDGATHVVAFGPDGGAHFLGSPIDLLRLAAIGYEEISNRVLGEAPQDPALIAGVGEFRAWVQGTVGVDVPDRWGRLHDDRFTAWVEARRLS